MMSFDVLQEGDKFFRIMPNGGRLVHYPDIPELDGVLNIPGVYCLRCKITDRYYVGSTMDLRRRLLGHYRKIMSGKAKRGLYSFFKFPDVEYIILESGTLSIDGLRALEQFYIIKLNSRYPMGFNKKDPFTGAYMPDVFDYLYNKK